MNSLDKQEIKKTVIRFYFAKYLLKFNLTFLIKIFNPKFYRFVLRSKLVYGPENLSKLKHFKNLHFGERAFLIGMGPSLKIEDLNKLKNDITFACNKIYLAFDQTDWRPTYYSVSDTLVAKNNQEMINKLDFISFHRDKMSSFIANKKNIIWLKDLKIPPPKRYFWTDIEKRVFRGGTVLYSQLQIAMYMGIKEIYLIGVDFDFKLSSATGERCDVGKILVSEDEQNHFHPDYRKPGETWAMPNLNLQEESFKLALKYAEEHGIKIYNASRKSKLEVFERVNFDELFH